jgi:hypothetical protein
MSAEYPKISIRLQELINQANNGFPSTGEAIMAAYNQALKEEYTPRQAKNILYDNIHSLDERTIRRYLPLEAKDTEKSGPDLLLQTMVRKSPQKKILS